MQSSRPLLVLMVALLAGAALAGCTDGDGGDDGDADRAGDGTLPKDTPADYFEPQAPGTPPAARDDPLPSSGSRIDGVAVHNGTGALVLADSATLARAGIQRVPTHAQVHTGWSGAEPSIGFDDEDRLFYVAMTRALRSTDGGFTFDIVKTDPITADPLLWVDRDTGRVFVNQLWGGCSFMHWSDDAGDTWTSNPVACGLPVNDHQKMTTAPRTSPVPDAAYPNVVYYCASQIVQAQCSVSHDGGVSWVGNLAVPPGECGGLHGMPWGADDGTVYLPYHGCGRPMVAVTEDEGLSWDVRAGPTVAGVTPWGLDPDVVTTPDGTVYMVYTGKDHLPYMIRSSDKGIGWDGPFRVSPPHATTSVFTAVAAGDDGRVAFAYLGSENEAGDPDAAGDDTVWNLYVTFALDASAPRDDILFVTTKANTNGDPIQRGSVCLRGFACSEQGRDDRNLLDFIDATIDHEGRVYVASADGCVSKACLEGGGPSTSRADEGALWFLQDGPSLLADRGTLEALAAPGGAD